MSRIILGKITEPIGLKGIFKAHLYSDTPSWLDTQIYVSIGSIDHRVHLHQYPYNSKSNLCALYVEGRNDRNSIKDLLKQEIWTDRSDLPELEEEEFYYSDLINATVIYANQTRGIVRYIQDYGSGAVMELDSGEYIHWVQVDRVEDNKIYIKDKALDE